MNIFIAKICNLQRALIWYQFSDKKFYTGAEKRHAIDDLEYVNVFYFFEIFSHSE